MREWSCLDPLGFEDDLVDYVGMQRHAESMLPSQISNAPQHAAEIDDAAAIAFFFGADDVAVMLGLERHDRAHDRAIIGAVLRQLGLLPADDVDQMRFVRLDLARRAGVDLTRAEM